MSNNKINELHERSMRILYKDDCSNLEELLRKNNSVTIRIHNIQILAIERYKLKNNFISCLFPRKEYSDNMRSSQDFARPNQNTL